MVSTIIVLSKDVSYKHIASTEIQGQIDYRLWREVFPTAIWFGSVHRHETEREATPHEIESRADRYAMQWQDVVAVVMDRGQWNTYASGSSSYRPIFEAMRRRFPECQIWVLYDRDSDRIVCVRP